MAFSPSEYIRDAMDVRGWTMSNLNDKIGPCHSKILDVLNGQKITEETAELLANIFDTSVEVWINLQSSFDAKSFI